MDKVKEKKQDIRDNGEKKKLTKDEKIKQAQTRLAEIVNEYHTLRGYLAGIKEID